MAGRPTDLTNELAQRIAKLVERGNYVGVAAQLCGVSKRTSSSWLARGRKEPDSIYGQFLQRILDLKQATFLPSLAFI